MNRYRLTPAAQRDLSSIWDFTEERWDVRQAETYIAEIRAAIDRVADDPQRGRACGEIRQGYRRYGIGSHLLLSSDYPEDPGLGAAASPAATATGRETTR